MLKGAGVTVEVTFFALVIGVCLGLALALCRLDNRRWLQLPSLIYTEIIRGTPMLVQILYLHFVIMPFLGLGTIDAIYTGIFALGMNSGAYLGEIFRGGILSIDKGQREAALSLGMTNFQVLRYVILPQAIVNSLPAIGNEFVTLIKDSSLVSWLAVAELLYRTQQAAARTYEYFGMYTAMGIMYFVMTFGTSRGFAYLEKKFRF